MEFQTLPNDMPAELREKIILQTKIDTILKNGGVVDLIPLQNSLTQLKQQLNSLITQVLGLEHTIDGIHQYDAASLNAQLTDLTTNVGLARDEVNALQGRMNQSDVVAGQHTQTLNALNTKTAPITVTNNALSIEKRTIEFMSQVEDTSGHADYNGTTIAQTLNVIELSILAENATGDNVYNPGHILMGAGDAGEADLQIYSETQVRIYNEHNAAGQIVVGTMGTSVAGVTVTFDANGVHFGSRVGNADKVATVGWDV
jgi:hypothetical protein